MKSFYTFTGEGTQATTTLMLDAPLRVTAIKLWSISYPYGTSMEAAVRGYFTVIADGLPYDSRCRGTCQTVVGTTQFNMPYTWKCEVNIPHSSVGTFTHNFTSDEVSTRVVPRDPVFLSQLSLTLNYVHIPHPDEYQVQLGNFLDPNCFVSYTLEVESL